MIPPGNKVAVRVVEKAPIRMTSAVNRRSVFCMTLAPGESIHPYYRGRHFIISYVPITLSRTSQAAAGNGIVGIQGACTQPSPAIFRLLPGTGFLPPETGAPNVP